MLVEKKLLTGKMNSDDSNQKLPEGDYRDALNVRIMDSTTGEGGAISVIKGTAKVADRGFGDICIGTVEDNATQSIIEFYFNPGKHSIWQYFTSTKESKKLIEWSGLNFQKDKIINASVIDNYVVWTDGVNNARIVDIKKAATGFYTNISEYKISLVRRGSAKAPKVSRISSGKRTKSYISSENLQFATRFIFFDNHYSPLSPYSPLSAADVVSGLKGQSDAVELEYSLTSEELATVKEVQILVRTSTIDNFSVCETIKANPNQTTYYAYYYGNKKGLTLSDEEQIFSTNSIPDNPKTNAYIQDRLFLSGGTVGQDDIGFVTLSTEVSRGNFTSRTHAKEGGVYEVGVVLYDENMKSVGVVKTSDIEIPLGSFSEIGHTAQRPYIRCSLGGTVPSWAKYYSLAVKKEKTRQVYFQCPVNVYFYVSDNKYTDSFGNEVVLNNVSAGHVASSVNKKIYLESAPSNTTSHSYLHLHLPKNVPFTPDTSYYVRILNNVGATLLEEPVIDIVDGDKLVTKNFGITDFTKVSTMKWFVEVYSKREEVEDELFYETSDVYPIVNGGFSSPNLLLVGDTYSITHQYENTLFTWDDRFADNNWALKYAQHTYFQQKVESPTPCFSAVSSGEVIMLNESGVYGTNKKSFLGITYSKKKVVRGMTQETKLIQGSNYLLDYSKIDSSLGKATIKLDVHQKLKLDNSVRYSDNYIPNSNINSLGVFDLASQHQVSMERGSIVSLVRANNVLLALHPQRVTSLYIGEGFIRQGEDAVLAKTEGVIGDDRPQVAEHGTINIESIVSANGRVYFFDFIKKEPCRYSNDGITPLATTYRMKKYFDSLCTEIEKGKTASSKIFIVGGYDGRHDEYLMSFQLKTGNETKHYATIGFSERKKGFTHRYSYAPEAYGRMGNQLFSINTSKLYEHYTGAPLEFYGTVTEPSFTFVSNTLGNVPKTFESISIEGSKPKRVEIKTPEGQETDMIAEDFETFEGVHYTSVNKDIHTQGLPEGQIGLVHGDDIRSQTANVKVEMQPLEKQSIEYVNVHFLPSTGHATIPQN